jgi:NADPH:quinone reductase-like Zn-dependent oxidoreductase
LKAIVYREYGPPEVLHLEEVEKPSPGQGEVLVRVHAAAANAADWRLMRADPFLVRLAEGLRRPRRQILGADIAGVVEELGPGVTALKPGDRVFGDIGVNGGFAEYAIARASLLASIPDGIGFEQAAASGMAAVTALQALRDAGRLKPGQKVLIYGASGGVGTFAVQLARAMGAEVTAVTSTAKLDQARALGADHVIDYTREDFARSGERYHLILGANGYRSLLAYRHALAPGGVYVMAGGAGGQLFQALALGQLMSMTGRRMAPMSAQANGKDQAIIAELLGSGEISPVIDRRYPLSDTAEALRYLEEGHARGKVIITVRSDSSDG